ncbi:MAG: serine/threonine-protein kinase [Microcoleaceae cyanobacterium]
MQTITLLNNRYQIIKLLSRGGFSETFLAKDIYALPDRYCVVKQLKPHKYHPDIFEIIQDRFRQEATILAQLSQANNQIPKLYEYFEEKGEFYLVQEWISGDNLADRVLQQGLLMEAEVKEILMDILPVLSYVHQHNIIHRDIKPDNIIWRKEDGKPVLIDFGAVKETMGIVLNYQGKQISSMIMGTSGFMAPEQASGRPCFASDIFSLGLTAIYLLTGKIPQELETDNQTGEILWRQNANVSDGLAAVLNNAIRFHPRGRYPTAEKMLKALQNYPSQIPVTEASFIPAKNTTSWLRKKWHKLTIMGVFVGVILSGSVGLIRNIESKSTSVIANQINSEKIDNNEIQQKHQLSFNSSIPTVQASENTKSTKTFTDFAVVNFQNLVDTYHFFNPIQCQKLINFGSNESYFLDNSSGLGYENLWSDRYGCKQEWQKFTNDCS